MQEKVKKGAGFNKGGMWAKMPANYIYGTIQAVRNYIQIMYVFTKL